MERAAGQWVGPTLRLISPLDEGAMGAVWLAEHTTLDRQVAIKFANRKLDAEGRRRFKAEANAAARINSPHIVEIYDVGVTDDGMPFCVMELLLGESLRTRLDRLGKLPAFEIAKIVTQAARALNAAHKQQIVHRDIKPGNIFLMDADDDLFVKLLDFGVAKQARAIELTKPGTVLGTPPYMSREQVVDASKVDHRADLWALTVIAYESLTGYLPFDGENIGEICAAIWRADPKAVSQLDDTLNEAMDAFFQGSLNKDIEERPGTAKELAGAFFAAASTLPGFAEQADSWQWAISSRLHWAQDERVALRASRVQSRPEQAEKGKRRPRSAHVTTVRAIGAAVDGDDEGDQDEAAAEADSIAGAAEAGALVDPAELEAGPDSGVTSSADDLPMRRPRWAVVGLLLLIVVVPIVVFAGLNSGAEPTASVAASAGQSSAGEPSATRGANAAKSAAVTTTEPVPDRRTVNSVAARHVASAPERPSAAPVTPSPQAPGPPQPKAAAPQPPNKPAAPPAPAPPPSPPPQGGRDLGF